MDKEKLSRYFWLSHEIEKQEKRKARLQKSVNSELATDIVTGSSSHFPYIETKFKITGVDTRLLDEIEKSIEKNIEEAIQARREIEYYINGIDEPQLREVLRSRFIDCQKWKQVGKENYISSDHARKMVREFLKEIS